MKKYEIGMIRDMTITKIMIIMISIIITTITTMSLLLSIINSNKN